MENETEKASAAADTPRIRLVALDLDGTVFDDRKQITPRTLKAMQAALDAGVVISPATGRTADGVPGDFLRLNGVRYAITSNGAVVYDLKEKKELVRLLFPAETVLPIYDLLTPFGGLLSIFIDGRSYADETQLKENIYFVPENLHSYFWQRGVLPDLRAKVVEGAGAVEKFSIMYPDEATQQAAWAAVHGAYPDVEITSSLPRNMELNAPGVTKGRGLLALAAHLGIDPAETMAFGDGGNDIAMLRAAGLGIAMGNAPDAVRQAADATAPDNNHDGVAVMLEKLVLKNAP